MLDRGKDEPYRACDRLVFEGYGWADSVIVKGLKMSQNRTDLNGLSGEDIGRKPVLTRDAGEFVP